MRGMMEAVGSNLRPAPLRLASAGVTMGTMDRSEMRAVERWLIRRAMAWFLDPEIASAIRRLVASGSAVGERYARYQREVQLLAEAWAVPPALPSEETP
jgi:hypothetical protein